MHGTFQQHRRCGHPARSQSAPARSIYKSEAPRPVWVPTCGEAPTHSRTRHMNGRMNTPALWTVRICWLAAPTAQGVTLFVDAASLPGHGKPYEEAIS